jgi:ABC-2 type transport system permease protein
MIRLLAIVDKEWAETVRNRLLLVTVFVMPAVLLLLPLVMLYTLQHEPVEPRDVARFVELAPALARLSPQEVMQVVLLNQFLLFYLLMPSIIPMTVAAYSIIGEKQARSLEPLLATPISTGEILLGKAIAAVAPAVAVTWCSYGLFVVASRFLASAAVWAAVVDGMWLLAMLVIAPLLAVLSVLVGVVISSRVNDTRIAQQIGGFLVLPIVGVGVGQTVGLVLLSSGAFAAVALALVALDVAVYAAGERLFQRDRILTQWR